MKLEHFGMAEPGDCRVVFSAAAEELEAAVQAEKAAPDAPQDEDELLTAAVNTLLSRFLDSGWALIASTLAGAAAGVFFVELPKEEDADAD